MSIIRGPRPDTRFYTLDKSISEDPRLSWAARGLLIFLLGKPDHWEVSVRHLISQTKDAIGKSSGRDAVRVILKELEKAGYLTRDYSRSAGGSFDGVSYIVREIPEEPETENPSTASPETENPAPVNPGPANPAPENPPQVKNEFQQPTENPANTDSQIAGQVEPGQPLEGEVLPPEDDQQGAEAPQRPRVEIPADMPGPKDPEAKTYRTWANYAMAYRKRYTTWPIWNRTVAGKIAKLVEALGDEAPAVAAFYICIADARLIRECHPVGLLLQGCEGYRTQYLTGRQVTGASARQAERREENLNAGQEAARRFRQRAQQKAEEGERNGFL